MAEIVAIDSWASMFERRSISRTQISKGALLFFSAQLGVFACGVRDITNVGVCVRTQRLNILPLNFGLSFDNFQTVRMCRLIWRDRDFVGAAFES